MKGGYGGVLAALLSALALFALAGYQVTSETAATRLLGRLGAALVEIDRWLPAHREDIDLLARDRPQGVARLADLPVEVTLPASAVIDADDATLRERIVAAMGEALYRDGRDAFVGEDGDANLAVDEPVRWTASLLSRGAHGFWQAALALSLLALVAVVASFLMGGRSPLLPLIFGAGAGAAASFAAWLLAQAGNAALDSAVDREIMLILRDGAWIGLRDCLAVAVAGVAVRVLLTLGRQASAASPEAPSA